jgi:hypothetical protein
LNISDLSLLVQDVLGAIEVAVLPTTEQGNNMVVSGWQPQLGIHGRIGNYNIKPWLIASL